MGLTRAGRARVRARVELRLGDASPALPFVSAVVGQLAQGEPEPDALAVGWVEATLDLVLEVLRAAATGDPESAGRMLASEHALLAAFFQNVDLLYRHAHPAADAVSMATLQALHDATTAEEEPSR